MTISALNLCCKHKESLGMRLTFEGQGTRLIQVVYKLETAKGEPRMLIKFYT